MIVDAVAVAVAAWAAWAAVVAAVMAAWAAVVVVAGTPKKTSTEAGVGRSR